MVPNIKGIKLMIPPSKGGKPFTYREYTKIEGTTQKDTVSAIESNSSPNWESIPSILAIFPSKKSKIAAIRIKIPPFIGSPSRMSTIARKPRNIFTKVRILGINRFLTLLFF
jgi:hypothetical protein